MTRMKPILATLMLTAVAGCATEQPLARALDEKGRTESRATSVLTLARPAPRFSETARDYLYLAPIEINEMGTRRYFLWVGIASTLDRRWLWAQLSTPTALVLVFDGVPVGLPLTAFEPPSIAFPTPAPVLEERRAQVTLDQLERLATAESIAVELVGADGERARFDVWRGRWADWQPFVAGIGVARSAASE
jgi:hypothetical protein